MTRLANVVCFSIVIALSPAHGREGWGEGDERGTLRFVGVGTLR